MFCPSKITDVEIQMQDNLNTVLQSFTLIGAPEDLRREVINMTMEGAPGIGANHQALYSTLFPFITDKPLLTAVNEFLGSPASGILVGFLGPLLAPWVALGNSIGAGDGISEILANTVGAFFNGATLNLDAIAPLLVSSGILVFPPDTTLNHLSLALGGLYSTGEVTGAVPSIPTGVLSNPWEIYDSDGNVLYQTLPVGGSAFGSLGMDVTAGPLHEVVAGNPVGPFAAMQGYSELLGLLLGDNWSGKTDCGGFFCPTLPAYPPGVGLPPATIPDLPTGDDAGAGAGAVAGLDFGDLVNEFHDFFSDLF